MKVRQKSFFLGLLLFMMFSFPSVALAQTDEYGYNAEARTFKGTLDNWEAFLQGTPPTEVDWQAKDVIFIERKWDKRFDPMLQGNPPSAPGAWQVANLWEYLSGDQQGWTWHQSLMVVYSPHRAIPGAIVLTPDEIGFNGFYCVVQKEWLIGPNGEKTEIQDFVVKPNLLKRLFCLKGRKH